MTPPGDDPGGGGGDLDRQAGGRTLHRPQRVSSIGVRQCGQSLPKLDLTHSSAMRFHNGGAIKAGLCCPALFSRPITVQCSTQQQCRADHRGEALFQTLRRRKAACGICTKAAAAGDRAAGSKAAGGSAAGGSAETASWRHRLRQRLRDILAFALPVLLVPLADPVGACRLSVPVVLSWPH